MTRSALGFGLFAPIVLLTAARAGDSISASECVTSETFLAISLRPNEVLASPRKLSSLTDRTASRRGRREIAAADLIDLLKSEIDRIPAGGMANIDRLTLILEGPIDGDPQHAIVLHTRAPVSLDRMFPEASKEQANARLNGLPFHTSPSADGPSFCQLDKRTIAAGRLETMRRIVEREKDPVPLARVMASDEADDVRIVVNLRGYTRLSNPFGTVPGVDESAQEALQQAYAQISGAVISIDVSEEGVSEVVLIANSEPAADHLESLLTDMTGPFAASHTLAATRSLLGSNQPLKQASLGLAESFARSYPLRLPPPAPKRLSERAIRLCRLGYDDERPMRQAFKAVGALSTLWLNAYEMARTPIPWEQSQSNVVRLLVAMLEHERSHHALPRHAVFGPEGQPLLSWRVELLPHLGHKALYERFDLTQPWDSPANKRLLKEMPAVFADPASRLSPSDGKTVYLGVVGPEAAMTGTDKPVSLARVRDGSSKTIVLVQVNDQNAVEWTRPADYEFEPADASPKAALLDKARPSFVAGFCDGHALHLPMDIDPELLTAMFTREGHEATGDPPAVRFDE